MTDLTEKQVRHVAKLARLRLSDEEVHKFTQQLSKVFGYMEILEEVDTEGVEPTSQLTGLVNRTRPDEVVHFEDTKALLACSPLPIQANQIKVQSVL